MDTIWKHLKKYLEEELGLIDIPNAPNPVFKQAFASKLIDDAEIWIDFNKKRGVSTHDYSENKADAALAVIGDFIEEAIDVYEGITGERWQQ